MTSFEERFLHTQRGAVSAGEQLGEVLAQCLQDGAENVIFAGTGGAGILMQPAAQLLQARSTLPVHVVRPAELVLTGSTHLGATSVVVMPSLSGTTRETVESLDYCRSRGATVVALTGHADTPLDGADHRVVNTAADDTSSESFYLQSLLLALAIMAERGELTTYAEVVPQLRLLPELLLQAKRDVDARAERLAAQWKDEPFHIVSGAGSTWPEALYYAMCILEEMQWIRTHPVHASDFFHGTLELVEADVSVVLLKGEDASRPLVDRVERFVEDHTSNLTVLDAADVALPGIDPEVRALVSPVVLATLLERVSAHLEVKRDHPLTTRRYYRRVAY